MRPSLEADELHRLAELCTLRLNNPMSDIAFSRATRAIARVMARHDPDMPRRPDSVCASCGRPAVKADLDPAGACPRGACRLRTFKASMTVLGAVSREG